MTDLTLQIRALQEPVLAKAQLSIAETEKLASLKRNLATTSASVEVFELNVQMQRAIRVLDGDVAEAVEPELLVSLETEKSDLAALAAAIPIQHDRATAAQAAEAAARADFNDAVIPLFHAARTEAVAEISNLIDHMRDPLVSLAAADLLQESVVGGAFSYRGDLPLFSGCHVAKAFIDGVKERLRPPSVNEISITAEARARATAQMAEIQEDN
jgi:hypothetical protein